MAQWWAGGWTVGPETPQLRQLLQTVELVGSAAAPQSVKAGAVQVRFRVGFAREPHLTAESNAPCPAHGRRLRVQISCQC